MPACLSRRLSMSAASVRTSGQRDILPVLQGSREQRSTWLGTQSGRFEVFIEELLQLVVDGKLFLFAAFFFKAEQKPFPGRIIVFNLQVPDGADPGESVGKDPEQSAIAQPGVRGRLDRIQ
jgi:hypothetical protein